MTTLQLDIDNPVVEKFLKEECQNSPRNFIERIAEFIETEKIKQSIRQGFEEAKLQKAGKLEEESLDRLLDEL